MFFYFKIGYKPVHRNLFFRKSVLFQITEVAIIAEHGYSYIAKGKTIREMRIELNAFLSDMSIRYNNDSFLFYGHYCAIEEHLLESIWPTDRDKAVVIDFQDELNDFAADMPADNFSINSEYTLYIERLPSQSYLLYEKIEMIQSHPDYPVLNKSTAFDYAKWIMEAMQFPLFKTWKIGVGFLSNAKKYLYAE